VLSLHPHTLRIDYKLLAFCPVVRDLYTLVFPGSQLREPCAKQTTRSSSSSALWPISHKKFSIEKMKNTDCRLLLGQCAYLNAASSANCQRGVSRCQASCFSSMGVAETIPERVENTVKIANCLWRWQLNQDCGRLQVCFLSTACCSGSNAVSNFSSDVHRVLTERAGAARSPAGRF
jgi:hypothetical protein